MNQFSGKNNYEDFLEVTFDERIVPIEQNIDIEISNEKNEPDNEFRHEESVSGEFENDESELENNRQKNERNNEIEQIEFNTNETTTRGRRKPRIIRTGSRGRPRKQYSMKSQSNESEPLFPENMQSSNSEEFAGAAQTLNSLSLNEVLSSPESKEWQDAIKIHEGTKDSTGRQDQMLDLLKKGFLQLIMKSDNIYKVVKDVQNRLGLDEYKNEQTNAEYSSFSERFLFPLNSLSDVLEFNNEIVNNADYKIYLIKKYISIGGTDGNEDGKVVARKLLAIVFTKKVLTLFSWTGISRTKGLEKKESFQSCQGILCLFQEVVGKADSRWNQSKNEKFFKSHILKHAKQINEAYEKKYRKRTSQLFHSC
ncbi:hypothetical protein JTB14_019052 [Gonioctena quinquepunctata]|nr:hypothetical protein JTB14_019052 [Gonioctena quinquepunctata]